MHEHGHADHEPDTDPPEVSDASIYVCFEPDQTIIAERITDWRRTNDDLEEYCAREDVPINSPQAEPIKARLAKQIDEADVLICIVGATTWLSDWVTWELKTAKAASERKGLVVILLHEKDLPPTDVQNSGAVFIRFRREQLDGAIVYSRQVPDVTDDYMFLDD